MNRHSLFDLIDLVCDLMGRAHIEYAITGSVASSAYSEPYASVDVNLCLHASAAATETLIRLIPARFYHDDDAIRDAASRHSMINLTDNLTGWKVDLSFLPNSGYLGQVLARKRHIQFGLQGRLYWTVSPEDIVLMKLLWRKDTRSQKQFDNALAVVRAQGVQLEWPYTHSWADQLELRSDLDELKKAAGI